MGRPRRLLPAVLLVALVSPSGTRASDADEAMVFIRVFGDVQVERDAALEAAGSPAEHPGRHGQRVRDRTLGPDPDEPSRRARRDECRARPGRGGPAHHERDADRGDRGQRRRATGLRALRGRRRSRPGPGRVAGRRGRPAVPSPRRLGRGGAGPAHEGPGLSLRKPGRGGEAARLGRGSGSHDHGRLPLRRARGRRRADPLPPDGRQRQSRQQRRSDGRRRRLCHWRGEDEDRGGAGRVRPGVHRAHQPREGFPGRSRSAATVAHGEAAPGSGSGARLEGVRPRAPRRPLRSLAGAPPPRQPGLGGSHFRTGGAGGDAVERAVARGSDPAGKDRLRPGIQRTPYAGSSGAARRACSVRRPARPPRGSGFASNTPSWTWGGRRSWPASRAPPTTWPSTSAWSGGRSRAWRPPGCSRTRFARR